jgi:hypothetical protein
VTWDEHWAVLLSGAVASIVSVVGLFAVFWLTTRHDRQMERLRREEEVRTEAQASRAADVSRIQLAIAMQPKDMTFAPVFGNAEALSLLAACMTFATNQGVSHPTVAAWVIQQHSRVHRARQRFWLVCWIPLVRRSRAAVWGTELGYLGGSLLQWQLGVQQDDWFESRLERAT